MIPCGQSGFLLKVEVMPRLNPVAFEIEHLDEYDEVLDSEMGDENNDSSYYDNDNCGDEEISLVSSEDARHGHAHHPRLGTNKRRRRDRGDTSTSTSPPLRVFLIGAAVVVVMLLAFLWVPLQGDVLVDKNVSPGNASLCHNATPAELDKFLDHIDDLPQNERCVIQPGHTGCRCMNPVRPSQPDSDAWNSSWQVAHQRNIQLATEQQSRSPPLDVVLLGDSITESWLGTGMTHPMEKFASNLEVYHRLFDSPQAPVQGLALGISGDRCPQLLYRVQSNPESELQLLDPPVFWILIGTNDFLKGACHADEIVAGNIAIARELLHQRPNATVVLQSVLPVGNAQGRIRDWNVYSAINQRLSCYALSTPRVEFVNVTHLFVASDQISINEAMLPDHLHPNGTEAVERWGQLIVDNVLRILRRPKSL